MATVKVVVVCPICGGKDVVPDGWENNSPAFRCKACGDNTRFTIGAYTYLLTPDRSHKSLAIFIEPAKEMNADCAHRIEHAPKIGRIYCALRVERVGEKELYPDKALCPAATINQNGKVLPLCPDFASSGQPA